MRTIFVIITPLTASRSVWQFPATWDRDSTTRTRPPSRSAIHGPDRAGKTGADHEIFFFCHVAQLLYFRWHFRHKNMK